MTEQASILVKRYAGQRLYEPSEARYVTAEQVRTWHREGVAVSVRDAATGEDVTRAVLAPPQNEVRWCLAARSPRDANQFAKSVVRIAAGEIENREPRSEEETRLIGTGSSLILRTHAKWRGHSNLGKLVAGALAGVGLTVRAWKRVLVTRALAPYACAAAGEHGPDKPPLSLPLVLVARRWLLAPARRRDNAAENLLQMDKMMNDVAERVKKVVVELLGVDASRVTDDASFGDDLAAESLDKIELVMGFEEEFDCEIPDSAASAILTVGDAVRFIEKQPD